jgi:ATP adenylyltransferase/5',5'''-P-1,P-4-tetraphosphate phosphorylase II
VTYYRPAFDSWLIAHEAQARAYSILFLEKLRMVPRCIAEYMSITGNSVQTVTVIIHQGANLFTGKFAVDN